MKLPIRVAHPADPSLDSLHDGYFALLKRCGYEGLYLQDSPFDSFTGNAGDFKRNYHLIYLYDIAYAHDAQRYRDYIGEVCRRAAAHGLKTYLCCWEPRLPYYAWSSTPPHWRGRGGFGYGGQNAIAYCWSEPDAVAHWKQMARDALAAVPEIAGVHIGMVDNEASFCSEDCPKCKGLTKAALMRDVYSTFADIRRARGDFRIVIYDWWLPPELIEALPGILGRDTLVIGRSSQGTHEGVEGGVEDMTMIHSGCGSSILQQKKRVDDLGFRLVDMVAWSHANESFWLPAPPNPQFAIEKLNALDQLGAAGWYDFDCGAIEPGSVADAIALWTAQPGRAVGELVDDVLRGIHGDAAPQARSAYETFRRGVAQYPIAFSDSSVHGFSGRSLGLGFAMFAPFHIEDFAFRDTRHAHHWFAPFNLVTASTIAKVLPRLEEVARETGEAFRQIQQVPMRTPAAERERDAFEIHHRLYRSIVNYFRLGRAKRRWIGREWGPSDFESAVQEIALDEMENLQATREWAARNPRGLSNPCHHITGFLEEIWPSHDFGSDWFEAKRGSLERLKMYRVGPPLPPPLR